MTRIAVVMLACRDYEAAELALACHMTYAARDVPFFILQNGRGEYDCERTLAVAKRYEMLFPQTVRVVSHIEPGPAYHSILDLLSSAELAGFDFICKVDDDSFPIAPGWLERLSQTYLAMEKEGRPLAYATPLINNNTWGFPRVLRAMNLEAEYFATQARAHLAGHEASPSHPPRLVAANEIATGTNGTIWGYPHLARWLHARTTLKPDDFIEATAGLPAVEVPAQERYSIACILFRRELWQAIDMGDQDDEHMMHMHCASHGLRIVCDQSVPFVHLAYFSQREENRDIVESARTIYEPRLAQPFPIAMKQSRLLEIEARLRWLEARGAAQAVRP